MTGAFAVSPDLRAYAANTIFSTDIVDGEVKTADLANNAVTSAKIKDGQVKSVDLASGAITSSKITDGTIQKQDLAATVLPIYTASGKTIVTPGTSGEVFSVRCNNSDNLIQGSEIVSTQEPYGTGFRLDGIGDIAEPQTNDNYLAPIVGRKITISNSGDADIHAEFSIQCLRR